MKTSSLCHRLNTVPLELCSVIPFTSKVDPNFDRAGIKGEERRGKLGIEEWRRGLW